MSQHLNIRKYFINFLERGEKFAEHGCWWVETNNWTGSRHVEPNTKPGRGRGQD